MKTRFPNPQQHTGLLALGLALCTAGLSGCRASHDTPGDTMAALPVDASSPADPSALPLAARELPSDAAAIAETIGFLGARVKSDPDDFAAQNRLAGALLQRVRETNDVTDLVLAAHAARASLAAVPAEANFGGLAALAQVEFSSHEFVRARDHALRLTQLDPAKSEHQAALGDARLELGDYAGASQAFGAMWGLNRTGIGTQTRLARQAVLRGQLERARGHFFAALAFALNGSSPSRETVAWCRWQLGEVAFSHGDYKTAERHYREALTTFPGYFRALSSLGRVRAARGDIKDAIAQYEHAVRIVPDPTFVGALGDLYHVAGRLQDAKAQYRLVEQIGRLSRANGALYNRQLALFQADHNLKTGEAFANAVKEYAVRRDIYGADAVAWTALKAGHLAVAKQTMPNALRLGTQDARLFFHAGLIARAMGDRKLARTYLQRALALNPQFDPLQAPLARQALKAL